MRVCTINDCKGKQKAHGFCTKHLRRYERHGNPLAVYKGGRPRSTDHGSESRYKFGCRCEACREAKALNERERRHRNQGVRPDVPVAPLRDLLACLQGFGISQRRVAVAMGRPSRTLRILQGGTAEAATKDALEHVHWSLWRVHGPFRRHCKCDPPQEIVEEMEAG